MTPQVQTKPALRKWLWVYSILGPLVVTWFAASACYDHAISKHAEVDFIFIALTAGWIGLWISLRAFPVLQSWLKWLVLGLYPPVWGVFLLVLSMFIDDLSGVLP